MLSHLTYAESLRELELSVVIVCNIGRRGVISYWKTKRRDGVTMDTWKLKIKSWKVRFSRQCPECRVREGGQLLGYRFSELGKR